MLARYLANGTLDPDFGSGGRVFTPFGAGSPARGNALIQPDKKIVVVCNSGDWTSVVARYSEDGKTLEWQTTLSLHATAIVIRPDGNIAIAGGTIADLQDPGDFMLVIVNSDGNLLASTRTDIGGTRSRIDQFSNSYDFPYGVAAFPDNKVVMAGLYRKDAAADNQPARSI